jgi:hypothetical protein
VNERKQQVLCLLCSDTDRFMKSRSEVKRNLCGNFGGETENIYRSIMLRLVLNK